MKLVPKALFLTLALALSAAGRAAAQDAAPAAEDTAAARELLEAMNVPASIRATGDAMLRREAQGSPGFAAFEDVVRDFLRRRVSWEVLKGDYVALYARTFTGAELREMTTFFRSPAGRKLAETQPRLSTEGAAIAERAFQRHAPELERMVLQRAEQLQARSPGQGQTPRPSPERPPARPNP